MATPSVHHPEGRAGNRRRDAGGEPILCDLEQASSQEIAEAIGSADAVVFAAGAGPGSGPERKWTVDHGAAAKLIEAAKLNSIDRYVMISSVEPNPNATEMTTSPSTCERRAKPTRTSWGVGSPYTIVRPHRLTDDPGDGKVRIAIAPG